MRLDECAALVVGATGSIGAVCARLLAPQVKELCLVGPRPERLLGLSRLISDECPGIQGRLKLSSRASDYVPRADLIVATTSAVEPVVDVAQLRPGCVVCDVARPPDISQADAARRDDVLVIESGEVQLPRGAELTYDIGLKEGTIYACLAETALLALERRFENFTLGREIEPEKVRLAGELSEKHGFELAELRSFGEAVPASRFARLAAINRDRFRSPSM
jgi:predicted amino acid dehydrogenase